MEKPSAGFGQSVGGERPISPRLNQGADASLPQGRRVDPPPGGKGTTGAEVRWAVR